jgi:hypothetical protein
VKTRNVAWPLMLAMTLALQRRDALDCGPLPDLGRYGGIANHGRSLGVEVVPVNVQALLSSSYEYGISGKWLELPQQIGPIVTRGTRNRLN